MTISAYNINNILRTYSSNFRIGKAASGLASNAGAEEDTVTISKQGRAMFESELPEQPQSDNLEPTSQGNEAA